MSLENRLKRLEQSSSRFSQFEKRDLKSMSNQELKEYIEELGKHRVTIGKYKGKKLSELSSKQIEEYEQELLSMKRTGL